ncbi:hypothetical protein RA2_00580 [Roseovarius sp. A-2]|uniref:hypothetical protein n=1 Tax=Roseovarius sp. A-2 TaxID=1570360 RepID=UPI0009B4FC27|nr:hypothetical protein [Roseovarius sp. A-2]GAW33541.1 hypothetical protein RA2_00580 [Roseovarius sp. A-2]
MRRVTSIPRLTEDQAQDLAAADQAAEEAHRRWLDALDAAEVAEINLVAAMAAYDLKRVQYRVGKSSNPGNAR